MDSAKLKQILRDQKIPFGEAVKAKIAYLKSDKIFDLEGPYAKSFDLRLTSNNQEVTSIDEAFGMVSTPVRSNPQPKQVAEPQPKKPMSMAERIAALRGAVSTPSTCMGYQRK